MQLCKYGILVVIFPLLLKSSIGKSENQPDTNQLEEEFLLFLADVTFSEGESIDPLNMLDIDDLGLDEVIQAELYEQTATEKDSKIMNAEIKTETTSKEDQ